VCRTLSGEGQRSTHFVRGDAACRAGAAVAGRGRTLLVSGQAPLRHAAMLVSKAFVKPARLPVADEHRHQPEMIALIDVELPIGGRKHLCLSSTGVRKPRNRTINTSSYANHPSGVRRHPL